METSNTSSQPSLDARHLVAQLPPGFPRGDEDAIDAVMQLAAFNEQQHHHHQQSQNEEPPPPHPADQGQGDEHHQHQHLQGIAEGQEQKLSSNKKRRANSSASKGSSTKLQGEGEGSEAMSQHQNWASFTGTNNEFEHLLRQSENQGDGEDRKDTVEDQDQGQQQQHEHDDQADASMEGDMLTRHGRPLSTTKRAAQNRAAQRAFRERRDQHVKEVEAKAKQADEALASAEMHRQRYEELLKIIAGLRADNQSLRLAINALGGNPPAPPPAVALPFPSAIEQEGEYPLNLFGESKTEEHEGQEERPGQGTNDGHLDGLSAVAAAAAAAAAAHAVSQGGDMKGSTEVAQDIREDQK